MAETPKTRMDAPPLFIFITCVFREALAKNITIKWRYFDKKYGIFITFITIPKLFTIKI